GNVQIVPGEAPDALRDLPTPDAVFIGGSGGRLEGILKTAMGRVRAGGAVAANLATLDHLTEAMNLAQIQGWDIKVTQVAVSRSSPIAGMTRLSALNPVWILSVRHKCEVAE
ncbi:MAG: cobalamin biosynthesis protein CbiE, partial [Chloroflexota bacterium]|nr:cobalamin biosynthesis protein CbiE [Chloroflexota bacterium]